MITTPRSGLEAEGLTSTTSAAARMVSPGRIGFSHFTFSMPGEAMIVPASPPANPG